MRKRCAILDRFDFQAGRLQGGDGAFTPGTRPFDFDVDLLDAEFRGLFSRLLRGTLARERRALTTSLEAARAGGSPTQSITLDVGNGDLRVVERRRDIGDPGRHITASSSFFGFYLPLRHFGLHS